MRSLILSNGSFLVALDRFAEVRDLYFPCIGLEDHLQGSLRHRIGVYVDGVHSWLSEDSGWEIIVRSGDDSLSGHTTARHTHLQIELQFHDVVYNEQPIFVRSILVRNMSDKSRTIKLYMGQQFEIGQSQNASTGYFDPESHAIIHYRGKRAFIINGTLGGAPFSDYAVGLFGYGGNEGTHVDAEDGILSKNPIEHGSVDSVLGFYGDYEPHEEKILEYWLAAGDSIESAKELNLYVQDRTPKHLLQTTTDYWKAWSNRYSWSFHGLSEKERMLFKKSLMLVRAHVDDHGGIIASADSDQLNYGKDTYAYVWMRDGAYAAYALDHAGYHDSVERFFTFANSVISPGGYFMHKYLPDGSLGSSWHPWIKNGAPQLPIQEDETALVICALANHYKQSRNLEFLEHIYNSLIEKAANFMDAYRSSETNLPLPTYDLWEEHHGIATYTASSVFGALTAASELAGVLGKVDHEQQYKRAANEVREAILTHLYSEKEGIFVKRLNGVTGEMDLTIDVSAAYGIFSFGVLPPNDPRLIRAFAQTVAALRSGDVGIVRYQRDAYYATHAESPNPWFVTTLWYAEYLIARATSEADFTEVRSIFAWVADHAFESGILSEQLDAVSSMPLSVAPLTWSHATYVTTVIAYLDKLESLGLCQVCDPTP
jgi:glucoamylase